MNHNDSSVTGTVAGIDIGSRSIELVVLDGIEVVYRTMVPTTFNPLAQCREVMRSVTVDRVVATGYGRKLFAENIQHLPVTTVTEIHAYGAGARRLFPEARTVLDIGGQDTKVIALSPQGKVFRFEMNDRCAAGTGKFLEFMAVGLQIPLETFGDFALKADRRVTLNSMCTVFAETEAVSLMARGESSENIAMGLHHAIVKRTMAVLQRVGNGPPVVFAGGVAHNPCMCMLLAEALPGPLLIPDQPDFVGALGAALSSIER